MLKSSLGYLKTNAIVITIVISQWFVATLDLKDNVVRVERQPRICTENMQLSLSLNLIDALPTPYVCLQCKKCHSRLTRQLKLEFK